MKWNAKEVQHSNNQDCFRSRYSSHPYTSLILCSLSIWDKERRLPQYNDVDCPTRTLQEAFHKLRNKWIEIQRNCSIHRTKIAPGAGTLVIHQHLPWMPTISLITWYSHVYVWQPDFHCLLLEDSWGMSKIDGGFDWQSFSSTYVKLASLISFHAVLVHWVTSSKQAMSVGYITGNHGTNSFHVSRRSVSCTNLCSLTARLYCRPSITACTEPSTMTPDSTVNSPRPASWKRLPVMDRKFMTVSKWPILRTYFAAIFRVISAAFGLELGLDQTHRKC